MERLSIAPDGSGDEAKAERQLRCSELQWSLDPSFLLEQEVIDFSPYICSISEPSPPPIVIMALAIVYLTCTLFATYSSWDTNTLAACSIYCKAETPFVLYIEHKKKENNLGLFFFSQAPGRVLTQLYQEPAPVYIDCVPRFIICTSLYM